MLLITVERVTLWYIMLRYDRYKPTDVATDWMKISMSKCKCAVVSKWSVRSIHKLPSYIFFKKTISLHWTGGYAWQISFRELNLQFCERRQQATQSSLCRQLKARNSSFIASVIIRGRVELFSPRLTTTLHYH